MSSSSPKPGQQIVFKSKLVNWAEGMDYCAIPVPASVTKKLGTKSAVMVTARVNNSLPFKVSLFPTGGGNHYIRVRASVRKQADLTEGDSVTVQIKVVDRADITIPKDLANALKAKDATSNFHSLPPGKKNFMIRRIEDAAKPETRAKRIEEVIKEARASRDKKAGRIKAR